MTHQDPTRAQLIENLRVACLLLDGPNPEAEPSAQKWPLSLDEYARAQLGYSVARNLRPFARAFCRHAVDGPVAADGHCLGCGAEADQQSVDHVMDRFDDKGPGPLS